MISLEQAKELVELLEQGRQEEADQLVQMAARTVENPVIQEIGQLTRELHDSLEQFRNDQRLGQIATDEIPDARDRLEYVIEKTELAANKTMDAVERSLPMADNLHEHLMQVRPQWNRLMKGRIELAEFKELCHNIDGLMTQVEGDSSELRSQLTEILMAQDFQDLTGQIIRRVIQLVHEVEGRLVDILSAIGAEKQEEQKEASGAKNTEPEGPIINPHEREDTVASQDDVDDLLSSLGF
ncbi:protein phosphatase CheZ [Vibrio sp. SCSIO 43136]|uniref:protein phosphatase CheZ n=1 Tax=Vibrio sp. SCSIO 43136 TaxID=2819101 RepID=UPI0020753215|nr:protein phosphatase CheZ [Vibrio sp. SCSIO 43136]USD65992.1 protein phosphatase CheZ [Vibrio sp. SCSIO 43136]